MNRPPATTTLTWGTFAAAVTSACLLATGESGLPDSLRGNLLAGALVGQPNAPVANVRLPAAPTAAGAARRPATH